MTALVDYSTCKVVASQMTLVSCIFPCRVSSFLQNMRQGRPFLLQILWLQLCPCSQWHLHLDLHPGLLQGWESALSAYVFLCDVVKPVLLSFSEILCLCMIYTPVRLDFGRNLWAYEHNHLYGSHCLVRLWARLWLAPVAAGRKEAVNSCFLFSTRSSFVRHSDCQQLL